MDDPEIHAAFRMPDVPAPVRDVFMFLVENQNLVTEKQGRITGMNRPALLQIAPLYGIDLSRWLFAVRRFERGIIRLQESQDAE